jgi:hypothetical protein
MRRTKLYIDDGLWNVLKLQSQISGATISDLVRQAVREKYATSNEARRAAMRGVVGLWKDRTEFPETGEYVRSLRCGSRLKRIFGEGDSA